MGKRKKYKGVGGFNIPVVVARTPEQHRAIIQPAPVHAKPLVRKAREPRSRAKRGRLAKAHIGTSSIAGRLLALGFRAYAEYLLSPHWMATRIRWRESRHFTGWKCSTVGCENSTNLSLHHWTYERLGREELSDLVLVCRGCHSRIHRLERGGLPLDEATWAVTKRASRVPANLLEQAA